jgi:hypothetical protein
MESLLPVQLCCIMTCSARSMTALEKHQLTIQSLSTSRMVNDGLTFQPSAYSPASSSLVGSSASHKRVLNWPSWWMRSTSSTVSQEKRPNRWRNRAGPSTPMKRPREVTPIAKIPYPDAPDCQDDDDHPAYIDSVPSSGLSRKIDDDDQNDIPVILSTPSTAHVEETLSPSPETRTRRSKRMCTTS